MTHKLAMAINGENYDLDVPANWTLLQLLRDHLSLSGTKDACRQGTCGSCTVLVNGEAVKSCTLLAVQADGSEITTIEGLAVNGELHTLQKAFWEKHGLQCGYCTPGMILTAVDLLKRNPHPDEHEIRRGIEGNLCRCTGYQNIVKAIQWAAENQ